MYSGVAPLIVYAFTGTSRQLAVGPVALVSLLVEVMLRMREPSAILQLTTETPSDTPRPTR